METVKLMDSGTSLVDASSLEEAVRLVRKTMEEGKGIITEEDGKLRLDFSGKLFRRVILARVEETSARDRFAVSFQEGNAARCPLWVFPSVISLRRMRGIFAALSR